MRWLLTASLFVGISALPVVAQRSVSMGHTSGFSGHAGGFSAPHGFAAPHFGGGFNAGTHFSPAPIMRQRNFSRAPQYRWNTPARSIGNQLYRSPYAGGRFSPDHHHGHRRYPYSHFRQPYAPFFFARSTYLVPGLLNDYWDYQDNWSTNDQPAEYSNSTQDSNQEQAENNGYAPEPAPSYEPQQQAQDVPPPPPAPSEPLPQVAVTLVFKDGHSQQIHNYAMTKTTLYVLDDAASGRRPEISFEQIDVSATQRANREAGVDFAVPE